MALCSEFLVCILFIHLICGFCFTPSTCLVPRPLFFRRARIFLCASETDADAESLRQRIAEVQELEGQREEQREKELLQRIADVRSADGAEAELYAHGKIVSMPVVCYDGLLPKQCLVLDTEDPTFSRFLSELGLGGLFVMVAFDGKRRKLRRHGVIVRITCVDALRGAKVPTAVHACLVGRARACVLGPSIEMVARAGRYRRGYDEDGEELALGWGMERFVDATPVYAAELEKIEADILPKSADDKLSRSKWTALPVQVLVEPGEIVPGVQHVTPAVEVELEATEKEKALGKLLIKSLERWQQLAREPRTYDNIDVVARTRARHGHPGLRVDPARLIDKVLENLGPMPSASHAPTALALWGAALANPVPPLGVSPEMRAAVLEAPTALRRLEMVLNGVRRSIKNLEGEVPL